MKYDADTFREFIIAYELCQTNEDRESFVVNMFKPIDDIWLDNQQSFIRELNSILWVQTMGSQIEFPYGKCIHHTDRTHREVMVRVKEHCQSTMNGIAYFAKTIMKSIEAEEKAKKAVDANSEFAKL